MLSETCFLFKYYPNFFKVYAFTHLRFLATQISQNSFHIYLQTFYIKKVIFFHLKTFSIKNFLTYNNYILKVKIKAVYSK